jgi:hypothetical protein
MRIAYSLPLLVGLLAGCQKEEVAKAPEPPVHNAMTEYVANGVTAMHKADSVANTANDKIQAAQKQAQSAQEP